jgi:hypothetical protein
MVPQVLTLLLLPILLQLKHLMGLGHMEKVHLLHMVHLARHVPALASPAGIPEPPAQSAADSPHSPTSDVRTPSWPPKDETMQGWLGRQWW